ncbi:nitrate ABC transporter permease [Flavobacterium cellulosilyticum]|uniref:Nitrate ABC transporter, permease protein n=1 Tax=Flavobacterium cellulosilyticum TaxID=2541731 RepID=A0A4R5CB51_9FLAO|nr:nitrate ABC transporter permease [Flavobacterium cellulosilyticum]TDD94302.1 nitrate ABC transporter, permease protein [Flavobacterium cellulosilyticum]
MSDKNTLTLQENDETINIFEKSNVKSSIRDFKFKSALSTILLKTKSLILACIGLLLFGGLWSLLSLYTKDALPGPTATLTVLKEMISDPFYDYGPNDKGIGLQLFNSIKTVLLGFTLGSLIAIPIGILMGASTISKQILYPIVQLLKPVSPLAWFPIGLVVFKDTGLATIFIVFITSLWSTLINTSFGVASIPQDHKNVAKAFGFSTTRYLTKILIPYSLPHIITGLRLSISVAWLVIVAGEMLSGGSGIGFFVWDSWNALSLEKVISAIIIIGVVGLLFDRIFTYIETKVAYKA